MQRKIYLNLTGENALAPLPTIGVWQGSAVTLFVGGLPRKCGKVEVTAVNVAIKNADGETQALAATYAGGWWIVTFSATVFAHSGLVTNGVTVSADGRDELGRPVEGWIFRKGDLEVREADGTIRPGEVVDEMRWYDAAPEAPRKGDVAPVNGTISLWNGEDWRALGGGAPAAHAATHAVGGSDPVTVAQSQVSGLTAALAGKRGMTDTDVPAVMKPDYLPIVNILTGVSYTEFTVVPTGVDDPPFSLKCDGQPVTGVNADGSIYSVGGYEWTFGGIPRADLIGVVVLSSLPNKLALLSNIPAPVALEDSVTRTSANGVKSSGVWSAVWGALTALPTGFTSLYDWCVSQLAGKLTIDRHPTGSDEYEFYKTLIASNGRQLRVSSSALGNWLGMAQVPDSGGAFNVGFKMKINGTEIPVYLKTQSGILALASDILQLCQPFDATKSGGYAVGEFCSRLDGETLKLYQCTTAHTGAWNAAHFAERDVASLFSTTDSATDPAPSGLLNNAVLDKAIVKVASTVSPSDVAKSGAVAAAFSTTSTYALDELVMHEGLLYRCTTAVTTAGAWDSTKWTAFAATDSDTAFLKDAQGHLLVKETGGQKNTLYIDAYRMASATAAGTKSIKDASVTDLGTIAANDVLTLPPAISGYLRDFCIILQTPSTLPTFTFPIASTDLEPWSENIPTWAASTIYRITMTETRSGKWEIHTASKGVTA